jgi:RNA polymerase sigma-70 factor (ECF subfamily)
VPPAEVDDVVAETFVVAWRRIGSMPDPALPWLLGVARGVAANTTRSANRRNALHTRLASAEPAPDRAAALDGSDAESGSVMAALDRLSAADRELLTLIAWDGLTPAAAAQALGCSRATLAVRLHRARARLRAHMAAVAEVGLDHDRTGTGLGNEALRVPTWRPTTNGEDPR